MALLLASNMPRVLAISHHTDYSVVEPQPFVHIEILVHNLTVHFIF